MRILMLLSNGNNGSSFYRGLGPWAALAKKNKEVQLNFCEKPKAGDVRTADIVFMLRPCAPDLKEAAQACKDWGTPLWVDYDDQLLAIPSDNPSWGAYGQPGIQASIKEYLAGADLVTVSTPHLAEAWANLSSKIQVLPNALDAALYRFRATTQERNRIVLWRGTGTHDRDVGHVAAGFVETARLFKTYTYIFLGCDPAGWMVSEEMEKAGANVQRIFQIPDTALYFRTMAAIRPQVSVVPLFDNEFNRCKSNIAAIEGAYGGGCVVAPDWDEWRLPGVVSYPSPGEFGQSVQDVLSGKFDSLARSEETWAHVEQNLRLDQVNNRRFNLAQQLIETVK